MAAGDYVHVEDYLFAWRKLREPGLPEVERQSHAARLGKAWQSMNKHQQDLVIRITEAEKKRTEEDSVLG